MDKGNSWCEQDLLEAAAPFYSYSLFSAPPVPHSSILGVPLCFSFFFPSTSSQLSARLYWSSWKKRIWIGTHALGPLLWLYFYLLPGVRGRMRRKRPHWWPPAWGKCSSWDLVPDLRRTSAVGVLCIVDLTDQHAPDSTGCSQVLSFHPFDSALMKEKRAADCNFYCCCLQQ